MEKIYKNALSYLSVFVLLLASWQINAQISFSNSNNLLQSTDWHSGVGMAIVDMNNDKLDDILRLEQGNLFTIEFQVPGGQFIPYTYDFISGQSQWALAAGDVNNDGYNDAICGDYDVTKLITATPDNLGNPDYMHEDLVGSEYFAQGSNFADIDNDGFLDIFVCNDVGYSGIFMNNGDGTFQPEDVIDMNTVPASDNSGNYGSMWTDFDNDGDIDLYIAKCRQGVGDPTDPRRINALFVNDGNNNYTEAAADHGLKIGWQSWTSDFNDIDNDGDLDVFITNHDFANMVMENDGCGNFRDISTNQNIGIGNTSFPLQGVMRDFDNDGFVDILISGSQHHLYRNNGDKTFTEVEGLFDNNQIESYALGDLNNDGFVDIYAGYADIYTNPSNIDDVIWLNDGNTNNWFGVNLQGVESNRNAVGARVEIYGDWGVQIREVRAGESYGIMNSFKQNFGIGQSTSINYVVVKWPSGRINVIENPSINGYLDIIEDVNCETFDVMIAAQGSTILCEGETVLLSAPAGYNYIWNNGSTNSDITVDETGGFSVVVQDLATGCYGISNHVAVIASPDETPTVAVDGDLEFCSGETVTLTSSEADGYTWSNGETTQSIIVSTGGEYSVITQGTCDNFTSDVYLVEILDADPPVADDVEITEAGTATLTAIGDNPQWYDAEVGGTFLGEGPSIDLNVPVNTTFWVEDIVEHSTDPENVGMEEHLGNNDYAQDFFNPGILFNAFEPFTIKSVLVYTDTPGLRLIELRDNDGDLIQSLPVNIPETDDEGVRIDINFDVPVGQGLVLGTNADQNNTTVGTDNPRLRSAFTGVNYNDYSVEDVMQMLGSSWGGTSRYHFLFDWEIQAASIFCQSPRVPVNVSIITSTFDIETSPEVQLFPNPTNGQTNLTLDFDQNIEVNLLLKDLAGKTVMAENLGTVSGQYTHDLNLGHLAKGIYLIQVSTPEHTYFGKIAVQ